MVYTKKCEATMWPTQDEHGPLEEHMPQQVHNKKNCVVHEDLRKVCTPFKKPYANPHVDPSDVKCSQDGISSAFRDVWHYG